MHTDVSPPIDPAICVSVLSLCCKVEQVCEEVVHLPLINTAWEQALAIWGQYSMSADEHRRRMLTHTLYSSTVRVTTAIRKLFKQQVHTQICGCLVTERQAGRQDHQYCEMFSLLSVSYLVYLFSCFSVRPSS